MRARKADVDEKQRALAFAERVGLLCESQGLARMAGRVIGWLLICDPPHQSLVELGEVLQAGRRSVKQVTDGTWFVHCNQLRTEKQVGRSLIVLGGWLRHSLPDCQGQTHRKVGTQSHRSKA